MSKYSKELIQSYFKSQSFVDSDIESFNNLIEGELGGIIKENQTIEPTIIPQNIDTFKIKFDNRTIEAIKVNDLEFTYVAKDGSVKAKRKILLPFQVPKRGGTGPQEREDG